MIHRYLRWLRSKFAMWELILIWGHILLTLLLIEMFFLD